MTGITYTSSQKTRQQKLNSYLVRNSIEDKPIHLAEPSSDTFRLARAVIKVRRDMRKTENHLPASNCPGVNCCNSVKWTNHPRTGVTAFNGQASSDELSTNDYHRTTGKTIILYNQGFKPSLLKI